VEAHDLHIPIDKCRFYPGIPMRFEMDIERLGESIHTQGQLEPGMAVKRDDHYLIPDGRRRLLGCRYSRYHYSGPTVYWAMICEDLDEVQIFTKAFIKNNERRSFSMLEEVNYFREANKRFGAKAAGEIGLSAGREADYMKGVIEVCSWIEGKLMKLHKIEMMTEYRFRLSDLENFSPFRSEDAMFYQVAAAVAAARLMNPSNVEPGEIKTLVRYYAPWFDQLFPEYSTALQGTEVSATVDHSAKSNSQEIDTH
jgi:hypothetical protein